MKCNFCTKKFSVEKEFLEHQLRVHNKEKVFQCKECNEIFKSLKKIQKHYLTRHFKTNYVINFADKAPEPAKPTGSLTQRQIEASAPSTDTAEKLIVKVEKVSSNNKTRETVILSDDD